MNARAAGIMVLVGMMGSGFTACDDGTTAVDAETALVAVDPAGGSVGIAPDAAVVVTFDHPLHGQATDYMAVHEGRVTGPTVPGTWTMEEHGVEMQFVPDHGWRSGSEYTIHLGGGMEDAEGHHVDMETHGPAMGGEWATDGMMMGGMHGGQHDHMGEGWDHPENGSHGMLFSFTAAP